MSPCYERPSLAIHFTWKPDWDSVRKLLPLIEKELAPYEVRPHWGKLFALGPAQLRSRYERLADFKDLLKEHDPGEVPERVPDQDPLRLIASQRRFFKSAR